MERAGKIFSDLSLGFTHLKQSRKERKIMLSLHLKSEFQNNYDFCALIVKQYD